VQRSNRPQHDHLLTHNFGILRRQDHTGEREKGRTFFS
jgi:hypothetical protein